MSKKLLTLLILIFVVLVGGVIYSVTRQTYAGSGSAQPQFVIECGDSAMNSGASMTCYIKGKNFGDGLENGDSLSTFEGTLGFGSNLTLVADSITTDSDWFGELTNQGELALASGIKRTGDFNIASVVVEAGNINDGYDSNISLSNVIISNQNFVETSMSVQSVGIRIRSNVNALATLTVNSQNILTSQNTYNLTSSSNSVTIAATKQSNKSVISGDIGTHTLNYGLNSFSVIVTSESGIDNIYDINITRPDVLTFASDIIIKNDNDALYFLDYLTSSSSQITPVDVRNKITTSGQIAIKSKQDVNLADSDNVGTGSKLSVTLANEVRNYVIVIPGDTTGDGKVNVIDVAKLFQHYRRTRVIPEEESYYIIAGDVVKDDIIKLTDVAKLFQYIRGTINSLN